MDRLRDPCGLRRTNLRRTNGAPRPNGSGVVPVPLLRGFVRLVPVPEDQPAPKKRFLSAVVKVNNGEAKSETLEPRSFFFVISRRRLRSTVIWVSRWLSTSFAFFIVVTGRVLFIFLLSLGAAANF